MNRLSLQGVSRSGSNSNSNGIIQRSDSHNSNYNYNNAGVTTTNNNTGAGNNNPGILTSSGSFRGNSSSNPSSNGNSFTQSPTTMSPRSAFAAATSITATLAHALQLHEAGRRDEAWGVFKSLSAQRDPQGMYWTGYYYFHGYGGQPQDRRAAFDLLLAVTQMNLPHATQENRLLAANAHFYTAVCYLEGQGVQRDYTAGFTNLEKAADFGNAFAQFLVGDAYNRGSALVNADPERRNHYWRLAARQNEQRAVEQCVQLGIIF
jgi:TPR repeat protein